MKKAIIVFSGGQDSTTCLLWAISKWGKENVIALNINYKQRHRIECIQAYKICSLLDVEMHRISTDLFSVIGNSALIEKHKDISAKHDGPNDLPASFVPGRNIIFLTIAAQIAYREEIENIVTGVCQADFSGYSDCRDNTIKSLQVTLNLAMDYSFVIHTPLMFLNKAETVLLIRKYPTWRKALSLSHTCYEGKYPPCGVCPACILREKGFKQAGINDPLFER